MRAVSSSTGVRGLLLAVVALAVGSLITPVPARAAGDGLRGDANVREVKVLAPSEGRQKGQILVWVRARHATPTAAAASGHTRLRHYGKVTVSVEGLGERSDRQRLPLEPDTGVSQRGYLVRFADPGPLGATRLQSLRVGVSVRQNLGLGPDGNVDATRSDEYSELVPLTSIDEAITPSTGVYLADSDPDTDLFVRGGAVTDFATAYGGVGIVGHAPIDPETGEFFLIGFKRPRNAIVSGAFVDDQHAAARMVAVVDGQTLRAVWSFTFTKE